MAIERKVRARQTHEASFPGETATLKFMNARLDQLIDEVLTQDQSERSAVVLALPDSLDGEYAPSVAKAWAAEIRQRKSDLRSGAAQAVPWSRIAGSPWRSVNGFSLA